MTKTLLLDSALALHAAGLAVVPVAVDGSKRPAVAWKTYQHTAPDEAQLRAWFTGSTYDGLGVITGTVSGGLEMLELEGRAIDLAIPLKHAMADHGAGELWARLTAGYLEQSPSGGLHWLYRVNGPSRGNTKLARRPGDVAGTVDVLIETRGEGGYTVVAPSAGRSHPTGKPWVLWNGGPGSIPLLTAAERDTLHAVCTLFDQMPAAAGRAESDDSPVQSCTPGDRPGDDFNARATWDDVIGRHGWQRHHQEGDVWHWTRPGKNPADGPSATTGRNEADNLYVFSSSTPFEQEKPYSKFSAHALLEHGGDFTAAASALRAAGYGRQGNGFEAFGLTSPPVSVLTGGASTVDAHNPHSLHEAHLARTVADRALRDRYCWTAGLGWMRYARGRWVTCTDVAVTETVRRDLIGFVAVELATADADRRRALTQLLGLAKVQKLASACRGILEQDAAHFDAHPDLLCVGNGVVDLATGQLLEHSPALLLTRGTDVAYDPAATSPDWAAALEAVPTEVADWLQVRFGQAATGHPTPDDVMPVLQGSGSNGKTTLTGAVMRALGDHATVIPERVLLANPSDHPTELMTLRGARLAMIEETPEAGRLSVKRLKDTVGTPTMTARGIRKDNVTWSTTHSLMLTTNYVPRITETDHGTWRRLALVHFPFTYTTGPASHSTRPAAAGLRERLRDGRQGQHDAVLAWVVAGARRWYDADRLMPSAPALVDQDTREWRAETDLVWAYLRDRIVFDAAARVISTELTADFNEWAQQRGQAPWSDTLFITRFLGHQLVEAERVEKTRTRSVEGLSMRSNLPRPAGDFRAVVGVRFRTSTDVADDIVPGAVSGVSGSSLNAHARAQSPVKGVTRHTRHSPGQTGYQPSSVTAEQLAILDQLEAAGAGS